MISPPRAWSFHSRSLARTLFDTEVTEDIRRINDEVNTIMDLYNFIVAFPRIELFMKLPIPGIVKFRKSKARLDAVVDRLIREHKEASAAGKPDPGDLFIHAAFVARRAGGCPRQLHWDV